MSELAREDADLVLVASFHGLLGEVLDQAGCKPA